MDWTQVLTIVGTNIVLILSMMGSVIAIWIHQDRKIDENRKETNDLIKAIREDMKDFHSKLERIDAEFKMHMLQEAKKKA